MPLALRIGIPLVMKEFKMTLAKIITITVLTVAATTSLGATKCDHKGRADIFANTNPPVVAQTKIVKVTPAPAPSSTQSGAF